jgi:tripartite-type tricarboxylate transporter receptor subunit TctC
MRLTRLCSRSLAAATLMLAAATAWPQQAWPAKPVRFVVGFAAGSITDVLARILGEHLKARLGQNVLVDNRPGANGVLAASEVARAAPDGYTVLVSNASTITVNPLLYKNLPYEPARDFAPVTLVTAAPFILSVNPDKDLGAPVASVADLVRVAKARPGALSYGSAGLGNLTQLTMELFMGQAGLKMVHVPYKGGSVAQAALLAREVDAVFDTPGVVPQIKAGKLKALAVSTAQRWRDLPEVPTMAEAGYAGFDTSFWLGVLVPAKTPPAVIAALHEAIKSAADVSATRALLLQQGDIQMLDPQQFAARIRRETGENGATIKRANISVE